ncbi:MAG: hypothetical protein L6R37_003446 [Teloschistes peruensis]|nr:MAG: hypothetical protein L6R37_003446 [Teloschistes peruensis]
MASSADRDVLSTNVKPVNYDISLHDLELGGKFGYKGKVQIELQIQTKTKAITVNAYQLSILDVQFVYNGADSQPASDISYDEKFQRTTFTFPKEISPSQDGLLIINFTGTMNNSMAGFYRSKYKPTVKPSKSVPIDGDDHCMFSTQFESCDARRAFPCFDEPNLKATFDFSIEIPEDLCALSNMPQKETKAGREGFKVVSFERSPVMSTYVSQIGLNPDCIHETSCAKIHSIITGGIPAGAFHVPI